MMLLPDNLQGDIRQFTGGMGQYLSLTTWCRPAFGVATTYTEPGFSMLCN